MTNNSVDWKVSDDRLKVFVRFSAPPDDPIPPEDFERVLISNGISAPLDPAPFMEAQEGKSNDWISVANGTPPTEPVDARLEYYVDPSLSNRASSDEGTDKADYKNLRRILNVEKGQKLVRKHDPIPGEPGIDVYGNPIDPRPPMDLNIPVGQGVELLENGHLAVADEDGAISTRGKQICVIHVYPVSGNISYRTGNIQFKGTVDISGDVQSGFEVDADGDILVKGMVEGAHLQASGDIVVLGGFQAGGKGSMKAGGSIQVRFANEGSLEAGGDVVADAHLLNCQVRAGGSIVLKDTKGVIAGGDNRAGRLIDAALLGTEIGIKTVLQIGLSDDILEDLRECEHEIDETTQRLAQIEEILFKLEEVKSSKGNLSSEHEEMRIRAVRDQFSIMGDLGKQNKTLVTLKEGLAMARRGRIVGKHEIFPGVVIRYPGETFTVKNPMKYTSFHFRKGEIHLSAL